MTDLVLVTGATGFVGRQVHRALSERGRDVRLVVREGSAGRVDCAGAGSSVLETRDLFQESDRWWADACKGVDTVIHAAWYVEPGEYKNSAVNMDCLCGTLALARGAKDAGVRRMVGLGTCLEYELSGEPLSVDTPLMPTSVYASAKAAAYLVLSSWSQQVDMEFVWCRLFYLYGEGEDSRRLVPYLRECLARGKSADLGSADQVRDYLDVSVAGNMIVDVALSDVRGAVNVCSGRATSVRELAEKIADEYGRRDLLRFGVRPEVEGEPASVVGVR